jgi:hypothetical protein
MRPALPTGREDDKEPAAPFKFHSQPPGWAGSGRRWANPFGEKRTVWYSSVVICGDNPATAADLNLLRRERLPGQRRKLFESAAEFFLVTKKCSLSRIH